MIADMMPGTEEQLQKEMTSAYGRRSYRYDRRPFNEVGGT